MRGFAMLDIGKTGWIEKPDLAIKNPTDVLIKTTAVAHCTSDVHLVESGFLPSMIGNIIGHEAVGVVVEVGSEVKDFKAGDRVAISNNSPFWGDSLTQKGVSNFCPGADRTLNPELDGMFSEYILFERADTGLAHIPDNVTDEQALMAVDMMATAYEGIKSLDIQFGDTVAVIGIGPVGLCGVEGCAISGAGKIIAVGHRAVCKEAALKMGASVVLDYADGPIVKQILDANNGQPVDRVLICGAYKDVLIDAFDLCRAGGKIANVAMLEEKESIPGFWAAKCGFDSCMVGCGRYLLEGLLALISSGRVHPENAISHVYHGFESIPEAFEKMSHKTDDLIKTISVF